MPVDPTTGAYVAPQKKKKRRSHPAPAAGPPFAQGRHGISKPAPRPHSVSGHERRARNRVARAQAAREAALYAELPEPGLVDTLANKTPIQFVGYGVQFQANIPGNQLPQPPPFDRWTGPGQRMYAPSELISGNFTHSDES